MKSEIKIRIAYAEPLEVIRIGLINTLVEFDFVIAVASGTELLRRLDTAVELPDVCILALDLPDNGGYAILDEIRQRFETMPVLVFTGLSTWFNIVYALHKGAGGYLLKDSPVSELRKGIKAIALTGYYYSAVASEKLFRTVLSGQVKNVELNKKELAFIRYAPTNLSLDEIAKQMGIGRRALDGIKRRLFKKVKVNNRDELVSLAIHSEKQIDNE